MSSQWYQEFIAERTRLLERIKELENENAELRKRLGALVEPVTSASNAMQNLSLQEKIDVFCSLFKGRDDVFARRWYSKTSGKAGYQPVCQNEWTPLCDKRKYKCADCPNRQFSPLTYNDYYRHLEGKDADGRDVIGLYVLNEDNTCHFLCTDFDDKNCEHGYQDDVLAFVEVCKSCVLELYSVWLNSINSVREPCLFGSQAELIVYKVLLFIYLIHNSFQIVFQVLEETGLFSFFSYKVVR